MNTYVYKSAKGGDICDYTRQAHAGPNIFNLLYAILKFETFKLLPGIVTGFVQFGKNIGKGGDPCSVGRISIQINLFPENIIFRQISLIIITVYGTLNLEIENWKAETSFKL